LRCGPGNTIVGTKRLLGKNTAADIAKKVAGLLGLNNANCYTGHCFKRTSITWCADSGMSLMQIKAHTGKIFLIV
jgi:hypothetical protein